MTTTQLIPRDPSPLAERPVDNIVPFRAAWGAILLGHLIRIAGLSVRVVTLIVRAVLSTIVHLLQRSPRDVVRICLGA